MSETKFQIALGDGLSNSPIVSTLFAGVDGCAIENLKCEQRCDFSAQGYSCSCSRGYRLADNKQDCVGKLKKNKLDSFFDFEACTYDVNWPAYGRILNSFNPYFILLMHSSEESSFLFVIFFIKKNVKA